MRHHAFARSGLPRKAEMAPALRVAPWSDAWNEGKRKGAGRFRARHLAALR